MKLMQKPVKIGDVFEVSYPFIRDVYSEMDEDGTSESPTWRPGVRFEDRGHGEYSDTVTLADAIGHQSLTVVGVYRPGKFPLRVFYTRKWRDPSGKVFGKGTCRVTSIQAFRSIIGGYRHQFELV